MRFAKIRLLLRNRGGNRPEKFASKPNGNQTRSSLPISGAHYRRASRLGRNMARIEFITVVGTLAAITRQIRGRCLQSQTVLPARPAAATHKPQKIILRRTDGWNGATFARS